MTYTVSSQKYSLLALLDKSGEGAFARTIVSYIRPLLSFFVVLNTRVNSTITMTVAAF